MHTGPAASLVDTAKSRVFPYWDQTSEDASIAWGQIDTGCGATDSISIRIDEHEIVIGCVRVSKRSTRTCVRTKAGHSSIQLQRERRGETMVRAKTAAVAHLIGLS